MPKTFTREITFDVHTCPNCAVTYAATTDFFSRMQRESGTWYCPNGHPVVFTKSELQKTKEELARVERDRAWYEKRERDSRKDAEQMRRRNAALRGHLTRMRTRIANGVCPVPGCKRSGFKKVQDHLATKHPDWLAEHTHLLDET